MSDDQIKTRIVDSQQALHDELGSRVLYATAAADGLTPAQALNFAVSVVVTIVANVVQDKDRLDVAMSRAVEALSGDTARTMARDLWDKVQEARQREQDALLAQREARGNA